MPGGPSYPHDQSTRYPLPARDGIPIFRAADNIQGIVLNPEGDIRTWVISAGVQSGRRDLITALAHLDGVIGGNGAGGHPEITAK